MAKLVSLVLIVEWKARLNHRILPEAVHLADKFVGRQRTKRNALARDFFVC